LDLDIPLNRISITMQPGDNALILRILQRLPEGKVLNTEELQQLPFEIGLLKRIR